LEAQVITNKEQSGKSAASQSLIALDHVHKIYHMGDIEIHALRGASLQIERGEFVAIMGASGSGKSTTMNILGCLDKPTRGHYYLDGQDVSKLSKDDLADIRNRKIGFVFQGFNLLSRTSAIENVELPMLYLGVKASERVERAKDALEIVGLSGRMHNMPNQLSGGQQQRVAIARALVNQPTIILADEPTGNLDSRTAIEVMDVFQKLNRDRGITIALVTHEPDIAQYASRVVVFKDGRIKSDYRVESPRSAAEELESLPPMDDDDEEDEE
jgi:putative ABC transport system ATP-binding protein